MLLPHPLRKLLESLDRLSDSIQQHEKAENERQYAKQEQDTPAEMRGILDAVKSIAVSQKTADEPKQWYKDRTFFISLIGIAAVIAYTTVTYLMWCTMNKTYKTSVESFRIDERAWVEIEPIKPELLVPADRESTATFICSVSLKNVGKTPALDIDARATDTLSIDTWDDSPDVVSRSQDMLFSEKQFNGVFRSHVPRVLAPNAVSPVPFPLTCQAAKPFPSGHAAVHYLIGRVNYCDRFGVKHWLRFCFYVINARGEIWACKNGNDEDRNDENSSEKCSK